MGDKEVDKEIDKLAELCVDWRPSRRKGLRPSAALRNKILDTVLDIFQANSNTPPAWVQKIMDQEERNDDE